MTYYYTEVDIISERRKGRVGWLAHVKRMPEQKTMYKLFKEAPEGKRSVGKARRCLDNREHDLKKTSVRIRRKIVRL